MSGGGNEGLRDLTEEDVQFDGNYDKFLQAQLRVTRERPHSTNSKLANIRAQLDKDASKLYLVNELKVFAKSPNAHPNAGELSQSISYMQQCCINALGVQTALQNLAVNAQLQIEAEKQMNVILCEPSPPEEFVSTVSLYKPVLTSASLLSQKIASVEKVKLEVLRKLRELAALHRRVSNLWQQKQQRELTKQRNSDNEQIKSLREKLVMYQNRLDLLTHLLTSLISGFGQNWAKHDFFLKVLKACEMYTSGRSAADYKAIQQLLREASRLLVQ